MPETDDPAIFSTPNLNKSTDDKMNEQSTAPEGPTDSHVLAQVEQDEKGLSQRTGNTAELTDIEWRMHADHIEEPIIAGISNETLWMLLRRFDKASLNKKHKAQSTIMSLS